MRSTFLRFSLSFGVLLLPVLGAQAQELVHAMVGKVTAVYPATKMIRIITEDESQSIFDMVKPNVSMTFDKSVKAMTTPASAFNKSDCEVVVFYYGQEGDRTVVAVEDLGPGPLTQVNGTVVKLDKHAHELTIKNDAGEEQTYQLDAKTLADSSTGVSEWQKFSPEKGMKVRITANTQNGAATALFIRALSL